MLLEASVGDSYGAGFEYVDAKIVDKYGSLLKYRAHPKHRQIKKGKYTDDTQMSLPICEAMLDDSEPWTEISLADRFVAAFHRDPRTGYSRRLYSILTQVKSGSELLEKLSRDSDRSGAAMRGWAIGLCPSLEQVVERSIIQAKVTHATLLGIAAACASALTLHYFAYDIGPKANLGKFIDKHFGFTYSEVGNWDDEYVGQVGAKGWMSVKAAVTAIKRNDGLADILRDCIGFTGDVDTVATIALGAASLSREVKHDLPPNLFAELENGEFGRDYIVGLDDQLYHKFLSV